MARGSVGLLGFRHCHSAALRRRHGGGPRSRLAPAVPGRHTWSVPVSMMRRQPSTSWKRSAADGDVPAAQCAWSPAFPRPSAPLRRCTTDVMGSERGATTGAPYATQVLAWRACQLFARCCSHPSRRFMSGHRASCASVSRSVTASSGGGNGSHPFRAEVDGIHFLAAGPSPAAYRCELGEAQLFRAFSPPRRSATDVMGWEGARRSAES